MGSNPITATTNIRRIKIKIYGPYLRKDNRLQLVIKKDDGSKTSMSYPKWLMEQHLGRKLGDDETVDHKDENPLNNELDNLQILSRAENARKSVKHAKILELVCKCCGIIFTRRQSLHEWNMTIRHTDGPFCSHKCVGKIHH